MKNKRITRFFLIAVWFLAVAGCATTSHRQEEALLVTPLPQLTSAVEYLSRHPVSGKPMSDDQMVFEVYKKRPDLKDAFYAYPIKVGHKDKYVILLVCSKDGKYARLEDASWTPNRVDIKWFEKNPKQPPEITMNQNQKESP